VTWREVPFARGDRVREIDAGRVGTVDRVDIVSGTCNVIFDDEVRTNARGKPMPHGILWIDLEVLSVVDRLAELDE